MDGARADGARSDGARAGARAGLAWILGGLILATFDAVLGPLLAPPRSVGLLGARTLWGIATLVALGVGLAGPVALGAGLLARLPVPPAARLAVYVAAGVALAHLVLHRVLWRQADAAFDGTAAAPLFALLVVLVGAIPAAVHTIGALVAPRPRLRVAALVVSALGVGLNHAFFRDDYAEIHATVGACASLLAGAALAPAVLDGLVRRPGAARAWALALAALALFAGLGPTPNAVRKELFRSPGAAGAWALAMTRWEVIGLPPPRAPSRGARFFAAPAPGDPPVAPTDPPLADTGAPVVVLVTIDAVRGDALDDRARDASWPALARLRDEAAHFTVARAPGSQTAVSLTATFSGRTFSELFWAKYGRGSARFEYAAGDPAPRLPALLGGAGVDTFKVVGTNFLANEFGTASGFAEEASVTRGRRHARAREIEGPLLARLATIQREPAFFYAHFMEPHAPYDRGTVRDGPKKERWLSEIAALDGTIARLRTALSAPRLRDRSWLFVSSDHGEAFGEHGTWEHTKTLYDEMIRVPLLVQGPGVVPRTIAEPVSLLDLGPTVLDLFGQETPAAWAGQSLVPLLRGEDVRLERPILAEGRLRRTIVAPDGTKVIVDLRRKLVEAYDLTRDPGELKDVWDGGSDDPAVQRARNAAAALEAYYAAREARAPDYERVYKP